MAESDMYTGEIVWHIPENVKDEIEALAEYRYRVKILRQNPEDVYDRMLKTVLNKCVDKAINGDRTL